MIVSNNYEVGHNDNFYKNRFGIEKAFSTIDQRTNGNLPIRISSEAPIIMAMYYEQLKQLAPVRAKVPKYSDYDTWAAILSGVVAVTKSVILKHNIIAAVVNSRILKHNVLTAVINSRILKHNILTAVTNSRILKHNILTAVTNSRILKHNIRTAVTNSRILKHNILNLIAVTNSRILKHNIISAIINSRILKHNILSAIAVQAPTGRPKPRFIEPPLVQKEKLTVWLVMKLVESLGQETVSFRPALSVYQKQSIRTRIKLAKTWVQKTRDSTRFVLNIWQKQKHSIRLPVVFYEKLQFTIGLQGSIFQRERLRFVIQKDGLEPDDALALFSLFDS